MSVECPAGGCEYSGTLDAVEGHIGGSGDALHEGVVVPDLREVLPGGGGEEGASEALRLHDEVYGRPLWVWVAVGLVIAFILYQTGHDAEEPEEQNSQEEAEAEVEEPDAAVEVAWDA